MIRVFAELEDSDTGSWGYDCPQCRDYLTDDQPNTKAKHVRCSNCSETFLVTFYDEQKILS